jgi:hypothetical protein
LVRQAGLVRISGRIHEQRARKVRHRAGGLARQKGPGAISLYLLIIKILQGRLINCSCKNLIFNE